MYIIAMNDMTLKATLNALKSYSKSPKTDFK